MNWAELLRGEQTVRVPPGRRVYADDPGRKKERHLARKRANYRRWYLRNKELARARKRAWQAANLERRRITSREYKERNLERVRAYQRVWARKKGARLIAIGLTSRGKPRKR
jgi:hypothetical protein